MICMDGGCRDSTSFVLKASAHYGHILHFLNVEEVKKYQQEKEKKGGNKEDGKEGKRE